MTITILTVRQSQCEPMGDNTFRIAAPKLGWNQIDAWPSTVQFSNEKGENIELEYAWRTYKGSIRGKFEEFESAGYVSRSGRDSVALIVTVKEGRR